jgi:hypothetical protein
MDILETLDKHMDMMAAVERAEKILARAETEVTADTTGPEKRLTGTIKLDVHWGIDLTSEEAKDVLVVLAVLKDHLKDDTPKQKQAHDLLMKVYASLRLAIDEVRR